MSKLPVGIQAFGLRELLKDNSQFESVMRCVKELGYDGVELAGLYGLEPAYIRDTLKEIGLTPISAHVALAEMTADMDKVIEDYSTIGVQYIVVPFLPPELRPNTPGFADAMAQIRTAAEKATAAGLTLCYHNHDFEFEKLPDGEYAFDHLYSEIPSELLKVEPDTCWMKFSGVNPAEYIRKYGSRCEVVHLKDFIKEGNVKSLHDLMSGEKKDGFFEFRPVGFGQQIWEPILQAALEVGSKWVIVEQDMWYDLTPMEAARRSREYLKILGW